MIDFKKLYDHLYYKYYLEGVWSWWTNSTLHDLVWKFKHRFVRRHQYNRLDTGLPPGYMDPDQQILYAVMNCLRQYMEHGAEAFYWGDEPKSDYINFYTNADGTVDEDGVKAYEKSLQVKRDCKKELDEIYQWWVNRYLKTHDDHEAYWKVDHKGEPNHKKTYTAMFELEEQLEVEADEMLARLMKHRRTLWYA